MADQQHRATDGEWASVKARAPGGVAYSTILELLHRIEALEAPQSGSIDLSHLSDAEREKMARWIANPGTFEVLEVAQPAKPNYPEKPDSSLVERVTAAIIAESGNLVDWEPEARAAIRAVAAWLRKQKVYGVGWVWAVERLEEEAER